MPFDAILALTDCSPRGLRAVMRAASLAQRRRCLLKIMYAPAEPQCAVDAQVWREASRRIASDIHARFGVLVKNVADTRGHLDAVAEEARWVDLLVVGPGWDSPDGSLLGDLRVERLQRVIPCPVLLARVEANSSYRRVLVAIDSAPDAAALLHLVRSIGHGVGAVPLHASAPTMKAPWRGSILRARARAAGRPAPAGAMHEGAFADRRPRRARAQLTVVGRRRRSSAFRDAVCQSAARQVLRRSGGDVLLVPHDLRLEAGFPPTD
ncbi:MAG TPA: hypothetical protein VE084_23275 [Burkholderiaceae bacterium]|nr:hypothetical protein [Burkholderiaceae bacterium]